MIQAQQEIPFNNPNLNRRSTDPGNPLYRPQPLPALLTPPQAAQLLAVSQSTVYRMAESRTLPCVKVGGSLRFHLPDLVAWIKAQSKALVEDWQDELPKPRIKNSSKTTGGAQ